VRTRSPWDDGALRQVGEALALVVVAGGRASRFGADKLAADLGGLPLMAHVLRGARAALPPATPIVAVGPEPAGCRCEVRWVTEEPRLGGPVAALAAGLSAVPAATRLLLVTSGDAPFAATALPRLAAALAESFALDQGTSCPASPRPAADAVVAVDPSGRRQPLLAAFRVEALRAAIGDAPTGRSMHGVLAGLVMIDVAVTGREAFDVDRPEDLATAQAWLRGEPPETAI